MKYLVTIIVSISLLLLGCQTNTESEAQVNNRTEFLPEPDKDLRLEYEAHKALHEKSNDSLWHHLAFQTGGCLTGGQYIYDGRFGTNGCVMGRSKGWEIFLDRDKNQLTDFLLSKLGDTATTKIHTCPLFEASEGELAVYGLQRIYEVNWFDFEAFHEFKDKKSKSSSDNHQAWLQQILENEKQRETLVAAWKQKAKE